VTFASPQPISAVLAAVETEVVQADAAFQIAQQRDWNRMIAGRSLLQGYDRLANLGLEEVRVTLALKSVRRNWFIRLWHHLTGKTDPPQYRLARGRETPTLRVTAIVRRNDQGLFETTVG
jgi:hypothetical protein